MRVGVTGIFASGKGTVCELFRELGASVIDTDSIAREIMEPGKKGLQDLIHEFGDSLLKAMDS
jgi:dephospho-CoA kinase